jgi:hypothetical protein
LRADAAQHAAVTSGHPSEVAPQQWDGPNRLVQVEGQWDPSVVCTVTRDGLGQAVLRFDSPNAPSGYWTRAD